MSKENSRKGKNIRRQIQRVTKRLLAEVAPVAKRLEIEKGSKRKVGMKDLMPAVENLREREKQESQ